MTATDTTATATAPSLTITAAAAARVQALAKAQGNPDLMLRIAVSGGGCSGFQYGFDLDTKVEEGDRVLEQHGVKVVIDEASLDLLAGSEVDFVEDLMAAAFQIRNPNATATCGCGTSFAL
jgi:iron-sulfur cluster insertion protein